MSDFMKTNLSAVKAYIDKVIKQVKKSIVVSWDELKGKPFYSEANPIEVYPVTELNFPDGLNDIYFEVSSINDEEYILYIDDIQIKGVVKDYGYYIEFDDGSKYYGYYHSFSPSETLLNMSGTHSVRVIKNEYKHVPISDRYLPSSVPNIQYSYDVNTVPIVTSIDENNKPTEWGVGKLQTVCIEDNGELSIDGESTGISKTEYAVSGSLKFLGSYIITGEEHWNKNTEIFRYDAEYREMFLDIYIPCGLDETRTPSIDILLGSSLEEVTTVYGNDTDGPNMLVHYILHYVGMGKYSKIIRYKDNSVKDLSTLNTSSQTIDIDNILTIDDFKIKHNNGYADTVSFINIKQSFATNGLIKVFGR